MSSNISGNTKHSITLLESILNRWPWRYLELPLTLFSNFSKHWRKKQQRLTIPRTAPHFPTGRREFQPPYRDTMLKSSNNLNTKLLELLACLMMITMI